MGRLSPVFLPGLKTKGSLQRLLQSVLPQYHYIVYMLIIPVAVVFRMLSFAWDLLHCPLTSHSPPHPIPCLPGCNLKVCTMYLLWIIHTPPYLSFSSHDSVAVWNPHKIVSRAKVEVGRLLMIVTHFLKTFYHLPFSPPSHLGFGQRWAYHPLLMRRQKRACGVGLPGSRDSYLHPLQMYVCVWTSLLFQ